MIDILMEQINKTVESAVEESARLYGPHYASSLEGFGDVHRLQIGVMASMKEVKSAVSDLVGYVNLTDPQELHKALGTLEARCKMLTYEALRMCEAVERYKRTISDNMGGDLTDLIKQFEGLDEMEEDSEEPDEPGEE